MASPKNDWMKHGSVGIQMAISPLIGYWIGFKLLDPLFGTHPVFTVFMTICGMIAGFLNVFRQVAKLNEESRKRWEEQHGGPGDNSKNDQDA